MSFSWAYLALMAAAAGAATVPLHAAGLGASPATPNGHDVLRTVGDFNLFGYVKGDQALEGFHLAADEAFMTLEVCTGICTGKHFAAVFNT